MNFNEAAAAAEQEATTRRYSADKRALRQWADATVMDLCRAYQDQYRVKFPEAFTAVKSRRDIPTLLALYTDTPVGAAAE